MKSPEIDDPSAQYLRSRADEAAFRFIKEDVERGEDVLINGFDKSCVNDKTKSRESSPGQTRV